METITIVTIGMIAISILIERLPDSFYQTIMDKGIL